MKVEVTDLGPVKKSLSFEVEPDEVARETDEVVRRLAARVRVPGFRAGKVPLGVVRTRFAKEVEEDVRDRLIARLHAEAARDKGLKPLGEPVLEQLSHDKDGPLTFRTTFEVAPSIAPKGYRGVEAREPAVAVSDADVEQALGELREAQARLVAVEGRAATAGDVIVVDVDGRPDEGEPFRRERTLIEVGATDNLPEFNERIHGAVAGTELDFPVAYPKEYDNASLAGKTVRYRLVVHEVKRREIPEIDDEFARDLGEFEDLGALRKRIREDLDERRKHEARLAVRQGVLDKVLLENPAVLPDVLVDEEIHHRLEEFVRTLMLQGMDPSKIKVDWKEIRDRQEAPARKAVHARLVLDAVAAAESISVEREEVDGRIAKEAERVGEPKEAVRQRLAKAGGIEALQDQLVREKTLDFLTSVANIQREE
ncbi:MAG: trigger factor [Acidobacteriia bacterium]|nr:trigger factor [Terriglobia bacterium]